MSNTAEKSSKMELNVPTGLPDTDVVGNLTGLMSMEDKVAWANYRMGLEKGKNLVWTTHSRGVD